MKERMRAAKKRADKQWQKLRAAREGETHFVGDTYDTYDDLHCRYEGNGLERVIGISQELLDATAWEAGA